MPRVGSEQRRDHIQRLSRRRAALETLGLDRREAIAEAVEG